jgi:tRNA(Ile)-lysidine synthase
MRKLLTQIKIQPLPPPGSRILLGVSGGADSVAMTLLLHLLAPATGWSLAIGHVNHGLRPEAAQEQEFTQNLAAGLGLDCFCRQVVVSPQGAAPEDAARRQRRQALLAMGEEAGAAIIALAHHAGDQAETLLMRVISGAGPSGLAGMRPLAAPWWRPLLSIDPQDLRRFLEQKGQSWCEDASNRDPRFVRNRVRCQLRPFLEKNFNPQLLRSLGRLAQICAREDDCWQQWCQKEEGAHLALSGQRWRITFAPHWHEAACRRFLRHALSKAYGSGQHVQAVHIDGLLRLYAGPGGKHMPLPGGWRARRERAGLDLYPDEKRNVRTPAFPGRQQSAREAKA